MTSRHDATSIHMAFNYTCPNTTLSSTTILLGPLSVSFSSQWRMLCSFRHRGVLSDIRQLVFRRRGGHASAACLCNTACCGRYGRSVTRAANTAALFPLLPMWFWYVCIQSYFPQPINLPGCTPLSSLTFSAFQWMAFGFIVAQEEFFSSCRSFRLP